jgi:hypothetical protein
MTLRTFLQVWGTIIFATETLHLPLHQFFQTSGHSQSHMFLVYMWPSGKIPAQKQTKKDLSHLLDWEVWNQQCSLPPQTSNYEAIIYTDASENLGVSVRES